MPPDVMAAMKDAEFEDFIPRLEAELKSMLRPCRRYRYISFGSSLGSNLLTPPRIQRGAM